LIDEVRVYKALPSPEQIAILACPDSLSQIAAIAPQMRNEAQRLKIRNAFLEQAAPDTARQPWTRLRELERERAAIETAVPTVMVMQELPQPPPRRQRCPTIWPGHQEFSTGLPGTPRQ
jgi:hypothetical protein